MKVQLYLYLLDIVFQIRNERTAEHGQLYLHTVLGTLIDWLHLDHSY